MNINRFSVGIGAVRVMLRRSAALVPGQVLRYTRKIDPPGFLKINQGSKLIIKIS
jgi:hypothetical protein